MRQANSIASDGKGTVVILSDSYGYISSDQGATWKELRNLSKLNFRSTTYANGKFVGGGSFSNLGASPDGKAWTPGKALAGRFTVYDVAHGGGFFYAATTESNSLLSSKDGAAWEVKNFKAQDPAHLVEAESIRSLGELSCDQRGG